ncbi:MULTISPECIES: DUF4446 family protein [Veillonella]|uniref:DUF4446 domain-containing protein n=1 Tax=Veillonella denticariosi JCM 15641 TaxID=1298594 RepID=A0A2S7ZAX3_9FIRM|nr:MULTISPECIES: DUF4446 family protein [Veillonella]ETS92202.1 PF14584 family protein [Veillonella sp. AS16]PQL20359.1 DUF4446 domain-containing protein [Veillonella denticariosi JCM 15641]
MFESIQPWIGAVMIILVIALLAYCVTLHIRLNSLKKKYDFFMKGENGVSLERKLSVEVSEIRDAAKGLESMLSEQANIRNIQSNTIQKIGFIKYNAFENIGNDLSFALTLLDGNNNGICISSIYGRSESRIFSKPIVKGKSLVNLSQEELESLNEALGERTNAEALTSAIVSK